MNLQDRLIGILTGPAAQVLATAAPLALVSGLAGSAIGAAVALPTFAGSGVGMLLFSLSTNLISSMVYDIIKPGEDDAARTQAIQRGINAGDAQVIALAAESIVAAGPNIAQALPAANRAMLITAIGTGLAEGGGALAAIAPQFSAALRDPSTNWAAVQQALNATIASVTQTMEANDHSHISNSTQQSTATGGSVNQTMRATKGSTITGSSQIVTGSGTPAAGQSTTASPGDLNHQRELLAATIARLQIRELQATQYGIDVPPHIVTEREQLQAKVIQLQKIVGA